MTAVDKNHPKVEFSFYAENVRDSTADEIKQAIVELKEKRSWTIGPPVFIDEDDGDFRATGGILEMYSSYPPHGASLPKVVDKAHYDEACEIIDVFKELSQKNRLIIVFAINQTLAGNIVAGEVDQLLQVGLLDEWQKALAP